MVPVAERREDAQGELVFEFKVYLVQRTADAYWLFVALRNCRGRPNGELDQD